MAVVTRRHTGHHTRTRTLRETSQTQGHDTKYHKITDTLIIDSTIIPIVPNCPLFQEAHVNNSISTKRA